MTDGYKIKRILVGTQQVYPAGWKPGSNTILYLPLKDDILDHTGNHTMTAVTSSYGTITKDSTGYYYFNGGYITSENYTGPKQATVSMWVNVHTKHSYASDAPRAFSSHYRNGAPYHYFGMAPGANNITHITVTTTNSPSSGAYVNAEGLLGPNVWKLQTMTYSASDGWKFYENGVLKLNQSRGYDLSQYNGPTNIGATFAYTNQYYEGYISEVIYEDKVRSADEITAYYNATKSNYGL